MKTRLDDYIDLMCTDEGRNQPLHVGAVHTGIVSCRVENLVANMAETFADPALQNAIIINVGGHVGYEIAAATRAQAVVNVDLNILQGVHHKAFARFMAPTTRSRQIWAALNKAEKETRAVWTTLLDRQPFEGFSSGMEEEGLYRNQYESPIGTYYRNYRGSRDCVGIGLEPPAIRHTQKLAAAGNIYCVVANIANSAHMAQLTTFVNDLANRFAEGGARPPIVAFWTNAIGMMNRDKDFCGHESSKERFVNALDMADDVVFGADGSLTGASINIGKWGDVNIQRCPGLLAPKTR